MGTPIKASAAPWPRTSRPTRFPAVSLHTGRPDVSFRMYPGGLRALVQGWTKNIATGAASVRWWFALLVVGWLWSLNGGWITSPWFYAASAVQVLVLGRRAAGSVC